MMAEPTKLPDDAAPGTVASVTDSAEAKRIDARRRFMRGVTAGSGLLIVTVYHQRAMASKKVLVSSAETCASLFGKPKKDSKEPGGFKRDDVIDAATGNETKALVCEDVPEYKLPRKKLK